MLVKNTLYCMSVILSLLFINFTRTSQNNCCDVRQLNAVSANTVNASAFPEDGCFAYLAVSTASFNSITYNTLTCTFNPPTSTLLSYFPAQMTFISQNGCSRAILSDPNNDIIHSYIFNNCQIGAEVPIVIPNLIGASALASNGTCVAAGSITQPVISTFSIDALCNLSQVALFGYGLLIPFGGFSKLAFSAPTSSCSFLVAIPSSKPNPFLVIPYSGCQPAPATTYSFGSNGPNAVAMSPNGRCLAVAYIFEDIIRIFSINPDCSLTLLQEANTVGTNPSDLAYSPDGSCLAVATSSSPAIFPVNSDCTIDTTNVTTLDLFNSRTVSFSTQGNCNLLAFGGGNPTTSGVFLFQRTGFADLALSKTAQQCDDDKGIFTLTVTNNGPSSAINVVVSDLVPVGLKIKKVTAPGWTVNIQGQQITATLPTLDVGATAAPIVIKVDIHCKDGLVGNCASVTSDQCVLNVTNAFAALQCKSCLNK